MGGGGGGRLAQEKHIQEQGVYFKNIFLYQPVSVNVESAPQ